MNFWLVLQIMFDWYCELFFTSGTENYFFIGVRIIFHGIVNYFFGLQYIAGLRLRGTGSSTFPLALDFFAPSLRFHLLTLCCKYLVMDKSVQRQIREIANNTITEISWISQLVNSTHTAAASNQRSSSTLSPLSAGSASSALPSGWDHRDLLLEA